MTDTERGELTAAELDLASGGVNLAECFAGYFMAPANGQTASEGTSNTTVSAMYDIRQNRS